MLMFAISSSGQPAIELSQVRPIGIYNYCQIFQAMKTQEVGREADGGTGAN